MAISRVGTIITGSWDAGDTKTLNFPSTALNGLLVVKFVSDFVVSTPTGWLRVDPYPGGVADVGIFCRLAPSGLTSLTLSSGGDTVATFSEYTGNVTSSIADCLDVHTTSNNSNNTGTTATSTQADALGEAVLGAGANESGTWSAQTANWIEDADLQSPGGAGTEVTGGFYSRILSATGTWNVSATNAAANVNRSGAIAIFKAAVGGGGDVLLDGESNAIGELTGDLTVIRSFTAMQSAIGALNSPGFQSLKDLSGDLRAIGELSGSFRTDQRLDGVLAAIGEMVGNLHIEGEVTQEAYIAYVLKSLMERYE